MCRGLLSVGSSIDSVVRCDDLLHHFGNIFLNILGDHFPYFLELFVLSDFRAFNIVVKLGNVAK